MQGYLLSRFRRSRAGVGCERGAGAATRSSPLGPPLRRDVVIAYNGASRSRSARQLSSMGTRRIRVSREAVAGVAHAPGRWQPPWDCQHCWGKRTRSDRATWDGVRNLVSTGASSRMSPRLLSSRPYAAVAAQRDDARRTTIKLPAARRRGRRRCGRRRKQPPRNPHRRRSSG